MGQILKLEGDSIIVESVSSCPGDLSSESRWSVGGGCVETLEGPFVASISNRDFPEEGITSATISHFISKMSQIGRWVLPHAGAPTAPLLDLLIRDKWGNSTGPENLSDFRGL